MTFPRSGVTSETVKRLILDAGVVYKNYGTEDILLGATEGGNNFVVEREIREIPADGLRGKTKGFRRIISENAHITTNLKEWSRDNFLLALAGTEADDPTTANMIGEYLGVGINNTTAESFTFEEEPIVGTEKFYVNGVKADWKIGTDYTITTTALTLLVDDLLDTDDKLTTSYTYDTGGVATHDIIKSKGTIDLTDYVDNIAYVGKVSGSDEPIVVLIKNALGDADSFEMNSTDQEEGIVEVQLSAHYDPTDLTEAPWEIRFPKIT